MEVHHWHHLVEWQSQFELLVLAVGHWSTCSSQMIAQRASFAAEVQYPLVLIAELAVQVMNALWVDFAVQEAVVASLLV